MIRLTIGNNTVDLTLSEKTTITQPIYLFEFVNQITLKKSLLLSTDISQYLDRYNRFEIINQVGNNNPLIGEVDLTNEGYYFYSVYEQSTSGLDTEGLNKIESGIAKVERTPTDYADYTSQNRTVNVYDKNGGFFLVDEDENFLADENGNYLI